MINIALFGPPGCGKGTQSSRLIEEYNLTHIAPGDIFRAEAKKRSTLGIKIASYIDKGNFVPEDITINLIGEKMREAAEEGGILLDGYPRNLSQANALDDQLKELGISLDTVLFLEVNNQEIRKRIARRRETMNRPDDQNEEVFLHRMDLYREATLPVAQYYQEQRKLIKINGVGTIEEVTNRIDSILEPLLPIDSLAQS